MEESINPTINRLIPYWIWTMLAKDPLLIVELFLALSIKVTYSLKPKGKKAKCTEYFYDLSLLIYRT